MALDEHRKPFNTAMWHYPNDAKTEKPKFAISELRARWEKTRDTDGATQQTLNQAWSNLVNAQMLEELKGAESELLQMWFSGYHRYKEAEQMSQWALEGRKEVLGIEHPDTLTSANNFALVLHDQAEISKLNRCSCGRRMNICIGGYYEAEKRHWDTSCGYLEDCS
jgi:hypothetical protein